jgi:hypothetical protein
MVGKQEQGLSVQDVVAAGGAPVAFNAAESDSRSATSHGDGVNDEGNAGKIISGAVGGMLALLLIAVGCAALACRRCRALHRPTPMSFAASDGTHATSHKVVPLC